MHTQILHESILISADYTKVVTYKSAYKNYHAKFNCAWMICTGTKGVVPTDQSPTVLAAVLLQSRSSSVPGKRVSSGVFPLLLYCFSRLSPWSQGWRLGWCHPATQVSRAFFSASSFATTFALGIRTRVLLVSSSFLYLLDLSFRLGVLFGLNEFSRVLKLKFYKFDNWDTSQNSYCD